MCLTSVRSLTKTNQSVSNIPLQHLGPCLNCKCVGTRWSGSCCCRIIYSVGRAARMCERVFLWEPQLWAAVSCNPPWSMARSVMSQLPQRLRGRGSKVKPVAFLFSAKLMWDQRVYVCLSQFLICQRLCFNFLWSWLLYTHALHFR